MASVVFSRRQEEVLSLIADGLTDKEIAVRLGLGQRTVRTYIERLFARHGLRNRAAAVRFWMLGPMGVDRPDVGGNTDLLRR